jgi:hypothetical protein
MPVTERLSANPATSAFNVVKCDACRSVSTHPRCLAIVTIGGLLFCSNGETACAAAVCGPCNACYGNENIFRCQRHSSKFPLSKLTVTPTPVHNKKTSKATTGKGSNVTTGKGRNRMAEYSAKELLILSQAYIHSSENSINGASKQKGKFWEDVGDCEHTTHSALGGILQGVLRRSPRRSCPQEPSRHGRMRQPEG